MGNKEKAPEAVSDREKLDFRRILILLLQGAIIGAGGILPGVSGGILCVAFGLYMPLMQLFANPLREIPRTWKKWLFVGIGGCLGLVFFAFVVDILFETSSNMAQCLFAGLIVGTMPSLFREAGKNPKAVKSGIEKKGGISKYIAIVIGFCLATVLFTFLALNRDKTLLAITPNMFWYGVCGFIIGMGFTIPGLTSSTVLIFLGLLQPMLDGALAFDFGVIIPVGLGVLLAVLILSRFVNFIFDRWYTTAFFAVIGMVIASTVAIIPRSFSAFSEIAVCIAAAIAGAVLSLIIGSRLSGYEK